MDKQCINFASELAEFQYNLFQSVSNTTSDRSYAFSPIVLTMSLASLLLASTNRTANEFQFVKETRTDIIIECSQRIVDNFTFDNGEHYIKLSPYKKRYLVHKTNNNSSSELVFIETEDSSPIDYNKIYLPSEPKILDVYYVNLTLNVNWLKHFFTEFYANVERMNTDGIIYLDILPFMHINDSISSIKINNAEIISLPFNVSSDNSYNKNLNVTMYIILPDENINLHDFLQNLSYSNFLKMINAVNKQPAQKKKLIIPKPYFELESGVKFTKDLKKLNAQKIEDENMEIDVLKVLNDLFKKVYKKIHFELTEEGAFSIKNVKHKSLYEYKYQRLNYREYAYFIMDERNTILLNGVVH